MASKKSLTVTALPVMLLAGCVTGPSGTSVASTPAASNAGSSTTKTPSSRFVTSNSKKSLAERIELSECLETMFGLSESIAACTRALNQSDLSARDRGRVLAARGSLLAFAQDFDQALSDFRKAEALGHSSADMYGDRGAERKKLAGSLGGVRPSGEAPVCESRAGRRSL